MVVEEITSDILYLGVRDWNRRLFDELIPLPDGTSYNSFLIRGTEKTALIDTVDQGKTDKFLRKLDEAEINRLDYVISNHAEQDHSGSLPAILEKFSGAKIVTMNKCKDLLMDKMHIDESNFHVVEDGETLSLGNKTLEFIKAPWVHWPETLLTYLQEDKILFPCDFFGSHWASSSLYVPEGEEEKLLEAAKRYYAEIMMPFRQIIKRHLKKLEGYDIEIVAPSHGPIHNNPALIIDAYKEWTADETENEIVIAYESMYGSTQQMIDYLIEGFIKLGITVKPFKLNQTDIGELAKALVNARTIILGSPTVLTGAHPTVVYAAVLANALRPKAKYATIVGSYGWQTNIIESLTGLLGRLNLELFEPVIIKGDPVEADFAKLDRLVQEIHQKHQD